MKNKKENDNMDYSIPYQIVSDNLATQNTRWFRAWLITFIALMIALIVSIGYIVHLLNTTVATDADILEIDDVETIDESTIKIGDDIWGRLPSEE